MSLSFTPRTEAELAAANLLPDGEYQFEVLFAEDQTSKKGNGMIKLKLGIYDTEGRCTHVYDYLVGAMESKLRHFADSTGLLPQYQAGTLEAQQTVGRTGACKIVVKEDKTGQYETKNEVKDYVIRKAKSLPGAARPEVKAAAAGQDDDDADVPF